MRTYYELVASNPQSGQRLLIAYTARKSRAVMYRMVCNRNLAMTALTGDTQIHFARRASDGATMGEWRIRYSGRTERDAHSEGELPSVGPVNDSAMAAPTPPDAEQSRADQVADELATPREISRAPF